MIGPFTIEAVVHITTPHGNASVTYGLPPGCIPTEQEMLKALGTSLSYVRASLQDEKPVTFMQPGEFFNGVLVKEKTGKGGRFAVPAYVDYDVDALEERVKIASEMVDTDGWLPITATEPVPLHDVIITAQLDAGDDPLTFMAYRKAAGDEVFYLSGTNDERVTGAYAWRLCTKAAPIAMLQERAP